MGTGIERVRELRRRRKRAKKLAALAVKVKKAKASDIAVIKDKVRKMTPGADQIFENWGIAD